MARFFANIGLFLLFIAFALLFLVSISLPFLTSLDIVRTSFPSSGTVDGADIREIRFGIWSFCYDSASTGDRTCSPRHHAYSVTLTSHGKTETIGSSWTRGTATTPVAAAVTLVALLLGFSSHLTIELLASLWSFLAALITLVAFAIDIALFTRVKKEFNDLDEGAHTTGGPGFWMTLGAFILLLFAGCTVCFHRRSHAARQGEAYPMTKRGGFFSRFRRTV